jgi:hypothetical protein
VIENKVLEVHCDIVEKSFSSVNDTHHVEEELPSFLSFPSFKLPLHPRSTRFICDVQLLQDPAEIPNSCEIRNCQMNTTIFHILQFQNSWLYVSSGETLFITCDADKESSSHAIKGVGILRLNETCKGYATRDILIPGKTNQEKHPDFIPNSILTNNGNWTSLAIMRNEDILNNIMDDLNEVSEEHDFLQFINNHTADFKTIKQHMESYDYFLYIYIYIYINFY